MSNETSHSGSTSLELQPAVSLGSPNVAVVPSPIIGANPAVTANGERLPPKPGSQVSVNVDELITGRKLKFPIYDDHGMLLLAEGMPVTAEVKQSLKQRGLNSVNLDESDAATATLKMNSTLPTAGYFPTLDPEIAKKIDAVIDLDLLRVTNHGPSVKESVVEHGKAAHDQQTKQNLVEQHQHTCQTMDTMMRETLSGNAVHVAELTRCTAAFLSNLIADRDAAVSLTHEITHDNDLADHSLKMSILGMAIAIELGLDSENVRKLGITSLVQDWGMMHVPQEIRQSTRPLDELEVLEIQKHPIHSVNMLQRVLGLPEITSLVAYQIHERPDGSGYPRGRNERTIHLFARILRVADVYVALTAARSYRKSLMPYAAMECMLRLANQKRVDREAVRALLKLQSLFPIGSFVALSDGSVAQVMRRDVFNYTQPLVRRVTDGEGNPLEIDPHAELLNFIEAGLSIVQAIPTPGREETIFGPEMLER